MTARESVLAAFALASSGRLDEARALLLGSPASLETEEGLDLLARIELSLGNETEARRLWVRAGGSRSRRALTALDSTEWRYRFAIFIVRFFILAMTTLVITTLVLKGITK